MASSRFGASTTTAVATVRLGAAAGLAFGLVAWGAYRFGAPPVAVVLLLALAGTVLLFRPALATVVTVFLLYVNFPAILTKQHGLPPAAAGAFLLLLAIPLFHTVIVRGERLRADQTLGLMTVFLTVLLLGTVGAVDRAVAYGRIAGYLLEGMLVYWLVINLVRTQVVLRRTIWAIVAAGSLVGGLSLYQEVTGSYTAEFGGLAYRNYVAADPDVEQQASERRRQWDRAQGPLDEPNRFAQVMIVLVPLAVFCFRTARTRQERLLALAAALIIVLTVGITLSRGAALTLAALAGLMVWIRWLRAAHLAVGVVALLVLLPAVSPHFLPRLQSVTNARYLMAEDQSARANADGAIRGRATAMLTAYTVFLDHPFIGVGPGQLRSYYAEYSDNPDIKFRDHGGATRRAHSLYFEMAAETGIAGLGVFLVMVGLLMRRLWRSRSSLLGRDPVRADLAAAFFLSLFAYMATAVFLHLSYQRYFWLMLGLAGAAALLTAPGRPDDLSSVRRHDDPLYVRT